MPPAAGVDTFTLIRCQDDIGDDWLAVSNDQADQLEKVCIAVFGKKCVSTQRLIKVNEFPENIKAAMAAAANGEKVNARFKTLPWLASIEIAAPTAPATEAPHEPEKQV